MRFLARRPRNSARAPLMPQQIDVSSLLRHFKIRIVPCAARHRHNNRDCRDHGAAVYAYVPWYTGNMQDAELLVERVQTGVRMEKRLLKVLKAFAEYHDMSLGDLLEGIVLHAFDGKC